MKKMDWDWSLLVGIVILVVGTFLGTYLIHLSNRRANTKRIEALEETFTEQNTDLKNLSEKLNNTTDSIAKISKQTNVIAGEVLGSSKELNNTTVRISKISDSIESLAKTNNEIVNLIRNEVKEKGSFQLTIPKSNLYTFGVGANAWDVFYKDLEMGYQLIQIYGAALPIILKIENNRLLVSTAIRDRWGNLTVDIVENEWALSRSKNFSINFDDKALEIIDPKGLIRLQIAIVDNSFSISMIYRENNHVIFVSDIGIYSIPENSTHLAEYFKRYQGSTKIIFKHHGENFQGKRLSE